MSSLVSPDNGTVFDFDRLGNELRAEDAYERTGQMARTLVHTLDLRIVVIALRAGKTISEHDANVTASVHALSGHLSLKLPDQVVDLKTGQLLALGAGLKHDVSAVEDSVFVLTLGWQSKS